MTYVGIAVELVLSGVGLAVFRWLMVADRRRYEVPVPKTDRGPITLDSDYRGLIY